MGRAKLVYDVFISHSPSDRRVADDIATLLRSANMTAFVDVDAIPAGANISDVLWEAISESRALIAVFSEDGGVHESLGFEVGAATAWNKPVFVVLNSARTALLPQMLQAFPVFPIGRIDELVEEIKGLQVPLTKATIERLKSAYVSVGVPTDELISSPSALLKLTRTVNRGGESQHASEVLLRELLRLRKRGQLPRLSKAE